MRAAAPRRSLLAVLVVLAAAGGGACREQHIVGALGGGGGTSGLSSCGAFVPSDDVQVCAASYLSGRGAESAPAVDIAADGTLVVAGANEGVDFGRTPVALLGGGTGALFRLRADGHAVLSLTRIGDRLVDMEIDGSTGRIAIAGAPFGVAALEPDAGALAFSAAVAAERVAAGGGLVAALGAGTVTILDGSGAVVGSFSVAADVETASDLALVAASQSVLVAGWNGAGGMEQPYLASYSTAGVRRWVNWGFSASAAAAAGVPAPSRGVRVAAGRDGKVYFLGQSEGGQTVFTKLPHDVSQPAAPNVVLDDFSSTANAGNAILAYVARLDPGNGNLEVGQFIVTRDAANGNRAQDVFPAAVAADEHGTVIVGGSQLCCLDRQSAKTFAGEPLTPAVPDAFFAVLAIDFVSRIAWTTMSTGGAATVSGVALAARTGVAVAVQEPGEAARGPLVTVDPLQPAPAGGGADTYFAVFPTP